MKTQSELVRAADENFVASFRKLAEHVPRGETRETEAIFSFVTGLPLSFFNGCIVTQHASPSELGAALAWAAEREVPFRAWVAERLVSDLREVPMAHGLELDSWLFPGMVLHPLPDVPTQPSRVTVVPILAASLDEFLGVLEDGGLSPALARRLISPSLAADPDVQLFVGRLDGTPVGTSIAIRSRDASGVYNVGTIPSARRRGVGAALTWAAVEAGRALGHDTVVLQSSSMGLPLYSGLGFRTVAPYVVFRKSSDAGPAGGGSVGTHSPAQFG